MAKIRTQPATSAVDEAEVIREIHHIVEVGTDGVVGKGPRAKFTMQDTLEGTLDDLEKVFSTINATVQILMQNLGIADAMIIALQGRLMDAKEMLEKLGDVSYDEELDHATMDLMDAFVGSGIADINADGELTFDSRVLVSKGDLKPLLREAISRWVDLKIQ